MWFDLHLANLILAWNSTKSAPLNGHYPKLQFSTYIWFSHAQSHMLIVKKILFQTLDFVKFSHSILDWTALWWIFILLKIKEEKLGDLSTISITYRDYISGESELTIFCSLAFAHQRIKQQNDSYHCTRMQNHSGGGNVASNSPFSTLRVWL